MQVACGDDEQALYVTAAQTPHCDRRLPDLPGAGWGDVSPAVRRLCHYRLVGAQKTVQELSVGVRRTGLRRAVRRSTEYYSSEMESGQVTDRGQSC